MSNIYGVWLREQREAARLTQQQLADLAVMTRSHIAHIEAGRRIPSKEDARRLDTALGTGNVLTSFLPQSDEGAADRFKAAMALEQQATMIREFGVSWMPGILQTEQYARAVLDSAFPPWSAKERDAAVMLSLMWFEDQPPVAYSEGVGLSKLHDSPAVVERLQGAYDLALGDALPLKESIALMRATARDYGDHD